jgi:phosphatidylinositol dimannoside acyltransferase
MTAGAGAPAIAPPDGPPAPRGRFAWLVEFWVSLLIGIGVRCPALARAVKPVAVRAAWWSSAPMRRGTIANARWLLGPGSSMAQRRAMGREVVASFFDFLLDLGRCGGRSAEELETEIETVEGLDRYMAARRLGRGAIVVTAHLGSFEVGVAGLRRTEPRIHVVFRRDRMSVFESMRSAQRRGLGVIEAPVDDGWPVWVRLRDALLADEVVMMQGDRLMEGQRGLQVPFLGGHIAVPTGPARLALAAGAPIIPIFSLRTPGGRVRIVVDDAVIVESSGGASEAVELATRAVTAAIERQVARHPGQWLMLRPVWCEDLHGVRA